VVPPLLAWLVVNSLSWDAADRGGFDWVSKPRDRCARSRSPRRPSTVDGGSGTGDGGGRLAALSSPVAPAAMGTGTLESARGSAHLVDNGLILSGEQDIFATPVSTATQASNRTAGTA
jgi:hypothetical protein